MHSSQFGITFTDLRGPVNSDGPIHCIRSLNRMVRYSVMPLPALTSFARSALLPSQNPSVSSTVPPLQFLLLAQQLLCLLANLMVLKRSKSDYLTLPYPPNPLLYPTTFLTSLLCLKNIMNSLMFSTRRRPTHSLHIDLTI